MPAYKLKFLSSLHVDSKGAGSPETAQEFVHSDTLSAAVCTCWAKLYPDTDQEFFARPGFTVSSAFPCIRDILFFPVPKFRIWQEVDLSEQKELKKIRWISKSVLETVLQGKSVDSRQVRTAGQFACNNEEFSRIDDILKISPWKIIERQRVSVDRVAGQSDAGTFFFAQHHFHPDCGLFFLASSSDPARFDAVINFLGDSVLGADRSSGQGHFKLEDKMEPEIKPPDRYAGNLVLSLYNRGTEDDLPEQTESCAYNIINRSGWIAESSAGRPPIRVFEEGSFFSGRPVGRIVSLIDEKLMDKYSLPLKHPVFRDFRAFSLPCAEPSWIKGVN